MEVFKKQDLVREIIKEFPSAGSRMIARIATSKHPQAWTSFNAAYSCVRTVRGANGSTVRNETADKSLFQDRKHLAGNPFGWIPPVKHEFDAEWNSVQFGAGRYVVLADIHIPFHAPGSITPALAEAKAVGVDTILLNGDMADFYSLSRFEKDPTKRCFRDEVFAVRQFLAGLREEFPSARIVWKLGNHEERWEAYLWAKCPEVVGIDKFSYKSVFMTRTFDVEVIGDKRPIRLGKLNVVHGHEYSFPIANPVNPSRGLFLRAKAHAMCAHMHQSSQHSEKTVEDLVLSTWSLGCLCNLHPRYRPLNNWNHGFAFVGVSKDGRFEVQNKKVIGGKIYSA